MKKLALLASWLFVSIIVFGQTQPLSLATNLPKSKTTISKSTPVLSAPAPNVQALLAEDEVNYKNGELFRIATAVAVNQNLVTYGNWETLNDGSRKMTMIVKSDGAEALSLEFNDFHLPAGATFRAFNVDRWHYSKLYTENDNRADNGFFLPMVYGDEIVLEIIEPQSAIGQTTVHLENVFYNYRETGNPMVEKINESDPCQVNVNCSPEGDLWQEENDGVARIYIVSGGGAGWCTGSLVNNTAQDCKPYFLTALHCGETTSAADMNNWVFYFGYEAPGCTNPSSAGTLDDNFVQSCFRVADSNDGGGTSGSDFLLVQLGTSGNEAATINTLKSFNARWNGWDINNTTSGDGVGIHHPSGDIKKISTYTSNLISTQWGSAPGSHWRVTWSSTTNGNGVTEGGSSGSPIFRYTGGGGNEDSKIIGTLTGGSSFCTSPNNPDQYGKMSYHWNSNGTSNAEQLEPWLDPGNTGVSVMNGSYDPCSTPAVPVADFTANQTTVLEGDVVQFTDLTSGAPTSWSWTITPGTAGVEWEYVNTTSSTSQNPEVQFNTAGTYTVELTATNGQGSDTETKVDYITVNAIVCGNPLNTAYTMGFETGEDLSQWVIINANGDANSGGNANTWGLYDFSGAPQGARGGVNVAGYFYNDDATTPGDDWIITGCQDLVAGATYTLSYWWTTDDAYAEDLEVFIGDDQTVAAMTTSLQDLNGIQDNTWNEEIITFTVPTSGEYYIGWHCTSAADQWYVSIDDINLSGVVSGLIVTNYPGDVTIECDESMDPSNTGEMTATTGCAGGATVTYTDNVIAGSCANAYTIERTWVAVDGCGDSETYVQTITVQDYTAPTVACGSSTDNINTSGGTATLPDYIATSTISDNCSANGDLIISQNPTAGTSLTAGTYSVDVTAEDECGNINSCTVTVTVTNNEVITVTNNPGDVTVECDESTDPSNTGQMTATTSCGTGGLNITYTDNIIAGSCANAYTIERTWTATDNCGNTETYVQTIAVQDNTAPVVTCGQSTDQINTGSGSANVPDYTTGSTFSDNCSANGDLTISQNPAAGTSLTPGTYTIDVLAEDECGNVGNCQVTLTIINDNGITITTAPNDVTVDCDESTDPSNTGAVIAQTSCSSGGLSITYSDVSDGQSCPETITRTWTVTDNCGNTETYDQLVVVDDLTAPTANPLSQIQVECAGDVPAPDVNVVTGEADNCTANPVVAFESDVSNGQTCPETITRTYSVTDDCGNETLITQTIVIEDVTNPVASNPADINVTCSSDIPAANTSVVTATDNCSANLDVLFLGDVSDGQSCPETITRTYRVTDECGNFTEVTQSIIVNDDVNPTISCSQTQDTIFTSEGSTLDNYTSTATVSDNCTNNPQVTQSPAAGTALTLGANNVTLTVTDDCGNTSTCTIEVMYEDDASVSNEEMFNVSLYPNPTTGNLTVDFGSSIDNAKITLYDANGRLVNNGEVVNKASYTIDLSTYAKGLYTVVINSKNGQSVHKVSKQ
tara:strand:+ start:82050 stop:86534 length:4485 start_codon:yes stop_codon:yes gene_type:complete